MCTVRNDITLLSIIHWHQNLDGKGRGYVKLGAPISNSPSGDGDQSAKVCSTVFLRAPQVIM